MSYRTKRPRTRKILAFGAGATLAITQLGAGCVPPGRYGTPDGDASRNEDDAGPDNGGGTPDGSDQPQ